MINLPQEAEGAPPLAIVPATPSKAKRYRVRRRITVPVGHALPLGGSVKQAFDVTVEAGARWHPEWSEPLITVNAYRFLCKGDAIGWSGEEALTFPLDPDLAYLATQHGQPAMNAFTTLKKLGLEIPDSAESIFAMVPKPAEVLQ